MNRQICFKKCDRKRTRDETPPGPANKRQRRARVLEHIGTDCVRIILTFLSVRDLCRIKSLQRRFGDLCCETFRAIDSISSKTKQNEIPGVRFLSVVYANFQHIREFRFFRPLSLSISDIKTLLETCTQLEKLALRVDIQCIRQVGWAPREGSRIGCDPEKLNCKDCLFTLLAEKMPNLKSLSVEGCCEPVDLLQLGRCTSLERLYLIMPPTFASYSHTAADMMSDVVAELVRRSTKLRNLTTCCKGAARYCMQSDFWKHLRCLHVMDYSPGVPNSVKYWQSSDTWKGSALEKFMLSTKDPTSGKAVQYGFSATNNFKMSIESADGWLKLGC